VLAAAGAALILVIVGFLHYVGVFDGNLRTVVPGRVYRSGQLDGARLAKEIREKKLRTVISLRGGEPRNRWFRAEAAACAAEGVELKTLHLTATLWPKPEELARLLEYFDQARYPLLFHCRGGADRSGLAATLYLHLYAGLPVKDARKQGLTWRYGHFPFAAVIMDRLLDRIEQENPASVREWILHRYPVVYAEMKGLAPPPPADLPAGVPTNPASAVPR